MGWAERYNKGKNNFARVRYRFMVDRVKSFRGLQKGEYRCYQIYTSSIWAKQTDFESTKTNWVGETASITKGRRASQGFHNQLRKEKFQDVRVQEALQLFSIAIFSMKN